MEKKLIHIFRKEYLNYEEYEHFVILNGVFDDGTWEPLLEYQKHTESINLRNEKGVFYKDRNDVIQKLKEVYESGKYKTLKILIK